MPGMLGIAVPWLLSLMACTLLAGHRLSVLRLSASVLISQLLFHALFVLGGITPTGVLTPHVHGVTPIAFAADAPVLVPQDAGMWFAHLVAAAATILALHRGETITRALLATASAVAAWLRRILYVPVRVQRPATPRWAILTGPDPRARILGGTRRRGPPRLV